METTSGKAVDARRHWNGIYAAKPETGVSWFEAEPAVSFDLVERAELSPSAHIIDVGAGASRLADKLLEAGYENLTLLDLSRTALDTVRRRLGDKAERLTLVVADITRWMPDRIYDLWHDRAVLHFLVEDRDRAAYRHALLSATGPGSQVIIATFAPSGPKECSGLPVRRYGRDELARFLGDEFRLLESFERDHTTPWGSAQRFHFARARRLAAAPDRAHR